MSKSPTRPQVTLYPGLVIRQSGMIVAHASLTTRPPVQDRPSVLSVSKTRRPSVPLRK